MKQAERVHLHIMENDGNKYSSTILIFHFLIWILCHLCVYGYNIETQKIGVLRGSPGSQFGYSVAFVNEPGWVDKYWKGESSNKVLLVGAPNTNVKIDVNTTIKGYGDVQNCTAPQTNTSSCTSLNIREVNHATGKSLCDQLRKDTRKSHCEEDQRLGATIAVNRKFPDVMSQTSTVPMVTVCAPGWKNVYNEFSQNNQKYMIGVCLKLRENLQYMDCHSSDAKGYCWPFWPAGDSAFFKGRPVFSYAQSGLSMDFSKDGRKEIIAAPGIEDWRGGFKSHQGHFEMIVKRTDHPTTQYYGYSLATGYFKVQNAWGERCNIVAGVPNFYDRDNGNLGKIEVLRNGEKVEVVAFGKKRPCLEVESVDMSSIKTGQVGSKFGSSVAAIDITGDGYDEIFVGAPLYTGDQPDEGRVFVYTTTDYELCGPIGILSGSALIKSSRAEAKYARFGSSVTSAGDLNGDGYKDVAIGAPYEDAGRGALYIYHGIGSCNCIMEDKFVQRILGRDLDTNLLAFGWSIYGEEDIDHNLYPDLAVGAYASDRAVVLRTRPIADVGLYMVIRPNPIPLNGSSLSCSVDKIRLCAEMTVKLSVSGKGLGQYLSVKLDLKADTVYSQKEGESRVLFRENGGSQLMRNFTVSVPNESGVLKESFILDVKNRSNAAEPKDIWTVVRIQGTFQLLQTHVSEFDHLDPVLKEGIDRHQQADVAFEINCDNLEDCTSDLRLTVQLYLHSSGRIEEVSRDTIIYVDASNEMQMKVDVTNLVSSSYGSNFTSSAGAALMRDVTLSDSRQGAIDASCKQSSEFAYSTLNCSADSKLDRNQNFKINAAFDISRARLMPEDRVEHLQPYIQINVTAGQVNNDVNKANNDFTIKLPVKLKFKIEISVDKETSDQIRYSADEQSTKIHPILHRYYITNEGPSIVPKTYVNITVPLSMHEIVYAELKEVSEGCAIEGSEGLVDTTTTPKSTETPSTRFTIQTPKPQRRRRELDQQEPSIENTTHTNIQETSKSVLNITCQEGLVQCVRITCLVKNLEKHDQKIINITIDIHEKSLAKTKNKREIRYGTDAVVTDPYVWFGGKVVPWDKTPFGEKYTTFLVEPATVVNPINIWIIIGSVIGAIVLLIIVVVVLWKLGFFKRKKHSKVKKWKQDSLYKRRSRASSTKSQQPYNPMEK